MSPRTSERHQVLTWLRRQSPETIVALLLELGPDVASSIGIGLYLAGSGTIASTMDAAFAKVRSDPKRAAVKGGLALLRSLLD